MTDPCAAETRCRGYDRLRKQSMLTSHGLCDPCLEVARRDLAALVFDYADLEQRIPKISGRAEHVSGTRDPAIPIDTGIEALQRAIWLTLTTWEEILRDAAGLSVVDEAVRDGFAVQRAVRIIEPRLRLLAGLPAAAVMPLGPDGPPSVMTGAEAILALSRLHGVARSVLGLTRLTHELAGPCPQCHLQALRRDDGAEDIYCANCAHRGIWDDYLRSAPAMVEARIATYGVDDWLPLHEAAEVAGCQANILKLWRNRGRITGRQVGRVWHYRAGDLLALKRRPRSS